MVIVFGQLRGPKLTGIGKGGGAAGEKRMQWKKRSRVPWQEGLEYVVCVSMRRSFINLKKKWYL